MSNDVAGATTGRATLAAVSASRGTRSPRLLLAGSAPASISNKADAAGAAPSALIATFCATVLRAKELIITTERIGRIMVIGALGPPLPALPDLTSGWDRGKLHRAGVNSKSVLVAAPAWARRTSTFAS